MWGAQAILNIARCRTITQHMLITVSFLKWHSGSWSIYKNLRWMETWSASSFIFVGRFHYEGEIWMLIKTKNHHIAGWLVLLWTTINNCLFLDCLKHIGWFKFFSSSFCIHKMPLCIIPISNGLWYISVKKPLYWNFSNKLCWKWTGWSRPLLHCWSVNLDLPKLLWWRSTSQTQVCM